jgi:RNA polymerase sigma-70 factor (ECF subfamily)
VSFIGPEEAVGSGRDVIAADIERFAAEHYPRLVRLAGLITRDAEEAQDAVQAALERAWRHRFRLTDPTRMRSWLDRIVVREAIRLDRRRGGLLARLGLTGFRREPIELAAPSAEPTDLIALRAAFAKLSPQQRAVISLHLYAGYSVAETADALGVPVETARSRLRLARARLRRDMEAAR